EPGGGPFTTGPRRSTPCPWSSMDGCRCGEEVVDAETLTGPLRHGRTGLIASLHHLRRPTRYLRGPAPLPYQRRATRPPNPAEPIPEWVANTPAPHHPTIPRPRSRGRGIPGDLHSRAAGVPPH